VDRFDRNARIIRDGVAVEGDALLQRASELASRLRSSGARCVATASGRADVVAIALLAAQSADCGLILSRRGAIPLDAQNGIGEADVLLADDLQTSALLGSTADRGFSVAISTSGTTGRPKLAWHSLDALLGRVHAPGGDHPRPRWLLTFHPASFAGLQVLLTALVSGASLISVSNPSVASLAEAAIQHRPTHLSATPTFWRSFLAILGPAPVELSLRQITVGGEAVDQATLDRLAAAFPGAGIAHIYASTEAGSLFSVRDRRAGFPAAWLREPVEGVQLRIRGGVLEVRSPRAMLGYAGGESPHRSLTDDGWLSTNDRVDIRGDRVEFLGRVDSIINVGGAKASPEAIEAVLLDVPGVVEAQVYGARNPITGEVVAADICLERGIPEAQAKAAILERARSRLQAHEVPRVLRFVDTVAVSDTGKKKRKT